MCMHERWLQFQEKIELMAVLLFILFAFRKTKSLNVRIIHRAKKKNLKTYSIGNGAGKDEIIFLQDVKRCPKRSNEGSKHWLSEMF